jgi:histidyl-tRNA synthetase
MKNIIQSIKGTREFYPEDMAIHQWLYQNIRQVSESFGYQEYDGPFLEPLSLYAAKSGDELVKEQSYVFPDRGGDPITLRPELTPSLARMVAQRQKQLTFPLRWWSFGPFWRYEKPQKGRSREFFQWNIDLIGVDSLAADAEIIAIGSLFLKALGFSPDQVQIKINNRNLMNIELDRLLIPQNTRPDVLRFIDRRDKLTFDSWKAYAFELGLSEHQFEGIQELLNNKDLWKQSEDMKLFFEMIDAFGVTEWVSYSPEIIRGLDYYTGIVFEAWDNDGEFRAILGGGRYDNLVREIGGEPLTGTGFAMGDVVMTLVLKKFSKIPEELGTTPAKILFTVFNEDFQTRSISLAHEIRQAGIFISCYPEPVKLSKQLKYADRMGYSFVIIYGPDEYEKGSVIIKKLKTGEHIIVLLL